jgi:uncharacterized membrane protein
LYALAVVWSNRHPSWFTLVLAALPFVWLATVYAKGGMRANMGVSARIGRFLPLVLMLLCLSLAWSSLTNNVRWLFFFQHVGVHGALCWVFSRTLAPGKTPLCTEFASWVHEDMNSPPLLWYTRQVTRAWAAFFAVMVAISALLFAHASADAWTIFSAVLGPILTAAFFFAENLMRFRFLPPHDRVGLIGTWRAIKARVQHQRRTHAAHR